MNPQNPIMKVLSISGRAMAVSALAALCVQNAAAQIPLPIYESFPYSYTNGGTYFTVNGVNGVGNSFSATGAGGAAVWTVGGASGGGVPLCHPGATLTYSGLYNEASVGLWITNASTGNRTRGLQFPPVTSGTLYTSFLLDCLTAPTITNRQVVFLASDLTGSAGAGVNGIFLDNNKQLMISKNSSVIPTSAATTALNTGANLVVVRYTFNSGADDDEVALWLNPSSSTFGAPESGLPTPTITTTTGTDSGDLEYFFVQQRNNASGGGAGILLDELRIATTWASVTATSAPCLTAGIFSSPTNISVIEGLGATFNVVATGTTPDYQWQVSTDSGSTWHNVTTGVGGSSQSYLTPATALSDSGKQFRAIATVPCNGSSATSAVATVTVSAAVATPNGVIIDDVFSDGYVDWAPDGINNTNSVWWATLSTAIGGGAGSLILTPQTSSAAWVGFYLEQSNAPVHLAVGKALKATLVFKASNITSNGTALRIGWFDYADGGTRPTSHAAAVANSGLNVRGYLSVFNFGTNFVTGNPFSLYARNALNSADLMGSTSQYANIGGGPAGYTNGAPAYKNDTDYTAVFTIERQAVNSVNFIVNVSGGGTNWTYSHMETNYCYPRFDAVGIRAATLPTTADVFNVSRLLVEVVNATPVAPAQIPLNLTTSGGNITLTWSNPVFTLQAAPEVTGTYTNVTGATSPYTVAPSDAARFFRLHWSSTP